MGNGSSKQPYEEILKILPNKDSYYIFEYLDGVFMLDRSYKGHNTINEIKVYIFELEKYTLPVTKKGKPKAKSKIADTEPLIIFKDLNDNNYIKKPDDIILDPPNFTVNMYSPIIYLSYLYATKSRKGKFNEQLIADVSKTIGGTNIYLIDAAYTDNMCEDIPLSLKIFISPKEQTYYQSLGYKIFVDNEIGLKKIKYLNKLYTMGQYINEIDRLILEYFNSDKYNIESVINDIVILQNVFKLCTDPNMFYFDFLNQLIQNNDCAMVEICNNSELYMLQRKLSPDEKILHVLADLVMDTGNISGSFYYKDL